MANVNLTDVTMLGASTKEVQLPQVVGSMEHQNDNVEKKQGISFGPAAIVGPLFVMTPDGILHSLMADATYTPKIDATSYSVLPNQDRAPESHQLDVAEGLGVLY
jgi:hypothetical protein